MSVAPETTGSADAAASGATIVVPTLDEPETAHFEKRWGAEPQGDGTWSFRLWAPGVESLDLMLDGETHPMRAEGDGWFSLTRPAHVGSDYGFVLPATGERDALTVPDPTARAQSGDVHAPSRLVAPDAYEWTADWSGRPWHETVLYEAHVGTFTPQGTFDAMRGKLDHLARLGVTALELMPIAQFAGTRGWGYDGVLLYTPHEAYGTPDDLKRLVDEAHLRGIGVFLDVVYNHFGPEGNYLGAYAPEFYHPENHTAWGAAIAYDRQPVRDFMVDNALYWLREYRIDGLRLDAIDSIEDAQADENGGGDIIEEIARAVREAEAKGDLGWRRHLTTEDARNITRLHVRDENGFAPLYDGEWNDDFHNAAHVLMTGEHEGYYVDHVQDPRGDFLRCLESGFALQGQESFHHGGAIRGEPSGHLPPIAFVNFLQNHDQTGNRAFGQRLTTLCDARTVEVMTAILLLGPAIPLIFMGEEWGETNAYLFHTDFHDELADAVREGRRAEFKAWGDFADPDLRATIPDPNARATRDASRLDWDKRDRGDHAGRMELVKRLLAIRAEHIAPRLAGLRDNSAEAEPHGRRGFEVTWRLDDGHRLNMVGNLGDEPFQLPQAPGRELFALGDLAADEWCVRVCLMDPEA